MDAWLEKMSPVKRRYTGEEIPVFHGGRIVADQVYFELHRLLRNPVVLEHPLPSSEAWERVDFFRHRVGWMHCAHETSFMDEVAGNRRTLPTRTGGVFATGVDPMPGNANG